MKRTTTGPADGPDLLLVLGWGNRLAHDNVNWLRTQFVDEGYRVHTFEIPTTITDFEREYVRPLARYAADLGSFRLVCHSTGGLIGPFVDGATTRTYLSPWWGIHAGQGGIAFDVIRRLPISRPVVPTGTVTREMIGALATEQQLRAVPKRTSPAFLREIVAAQNRRPVIEESAVVFCSLRDEIVSVRAIGEAMPAARTVLYDGGHELFSAQCRDDVLPELLAAVDGGAAVLRGKA